LKRRVIFRADGNGEIGLGHLVRSSALAHMLMQDFEIVFATEGISSSGRKVVSNTAKEVIELSSASSAVEFATYVRNEDIVVLDGYTFDTPYQEVIRKKGCKLVCIDDIHQYPFVADAVINQSASVTTSDYSLRKGTKLCSGFEYALLRAPFLEAACQHREISVVETAFVSMGGADQGNISMKVLDALLLSKAFKKIIVLMGSANENLASVREFINRSQVKVDIHVDVDEYKVRDLLLDSEVAFCPASSIAVECCAVGIPLFAGYTATNQKGILDTLKNAGACRDLGDWNTLSINEIVTQINNGCSDLPALNNMLAAQKRLVDGKSGERLLNLFKSLS